MYCLQPRGPVPTAIEWYNPQGQVVSRNGGDVVNQGGKYECRVTGPGDNLEKLPVCIGECYTGP